MRKHGARLGAVTLLLAGAIGTTSVVPVASAFARPSKREGDILRIFDNANVFIVTNDTSDVADLVLANTRHKERRVYTPDEWDKLPASVRQGGTVVYLINREKLPDALSVPARCAAVDADELFLDVTRANRKNGPYQIVLSAPDGVWLRQVIGEFRRLAEMPRDPNRRHVKSLAVVPVGAGAAQAAELLVQDQSMTNRRAHLLPGDARASTFAARLAAMDELILIDRSAAPPPALTSTIEGCLAGRTIGRNDTVAWRETKPGGHSRIIVCGPTADQVAEGLRHLPDPLSAAADPQVLCSARDLRAVRRVAVVAVRAGTKAAPADPAVPLTRTLAVKAASEMRSLDAFEVLERAALSEVLGEIALGQAGITRETDRARVRQLAAADALLLVEITDATGHTEYSATHRRLSAPLGGPPRRPNLPSRARLAVSLSGDEGVQKALDGVMTKVLGSKSDEDYNKEMRIYERDVLPVWQRQMDDYTNLVQYGTVNWEETVTASTSVTVSGSLRLVDLTDGTVLWEAPFTASDEAVAPAGLRNVTSQGENSRPAAPDLPPAKNDVPDALLSKIAEGAVTTGVRSLKRTALLPTTAPPPLAFNANGTSGETKPGQVSGRILDVDGDLLLVGLGASDGIKVGDTLTLSLGENAGVVTVKIVKVRSRTCDAAFDASTDATFRGRVAAGQTVHKAP